MERFDIAVGTPTPKSDVLLVYGIWAETKGEAIAKLLALLSNQEVQLLGVITKGADEWKERAKFRAQLTGGKN